MEKELEIELKFTKVNDDGLGFLYWIEKLKSEGFEIVKIIEDDKNSDAYFDTNNFDFLATDKSLRIREKSDKKLNVNYKNSLVKINDGVSRNEFKSSLLNFDVQEMIEKAKICDRTIEYIDREPKLLVINKRQTIVCKMDGTIFEFSLDDVLYKDPKSVISVPDAGIEIEIKNRGLSVDGILSKLVNLIHKTKTYDKEFYGSKYQKGMFLIKKEKYKVFKKVDRF